MYGYECTVCHAAGQQLTETRTGGRFTCCCEAFWVERLLERQATHWAIKTGLSIRQRPHCGHHTLLVPNDPGQIIALETVERTSQFVQSSDNENPDPSDCSKNYGDDYEHADLSEHSGQRTSQRVETNRSALLLNSGSTFPAIYKCEKGHLNIGHIPRPKGSPHWVPDLLFPDPVGNVSAEYGVPDETVNALG